MLLTVTSAWAAKGDVVDSGTCGVHLEWTLTENGEDDFTLFSNTYTPLTLTITGTGDMKNYASKSAPWYKYRSSITHIELPEGLTSVGNFAFETAWSVQGINLPASVTSIGESAFVKVGTHSSKTCSFEVAENSKLRSIATKAFECFGGDVDLRNCKRLRTIVAKVFYKYGSYKVYLPISIGNIEAHAFSEASDTSNPKIYIPLNNSVLYLNGDYKTINTENKNYGLRVALQIRTSGCNALSVSIVSLDEVKLTFDDSDKSFVIANEQDLISFGYYVNSAIYHTCEGATFKLVNDLDFTNMPHDCHYRSYDGNGNFVPIGFMGNSQNKDEGRFQGHFDGQGHCISGLSFSHESSSCALFSRVANTKSVIENVTLINPNFHAGMYAGGIVAIHDAGTIRNCNVVGGAINTINGYVGGIVGSADESNSKISDCAVVGTSLSGDRWVGCINGAGAVYISNCLYDANAGLPIKDDTKTISGDGNKPVYYLNLDYGVTSDAHTFGNYTVAAEGSMVKLTASREGYEFVAFNSADVTIEDGQFEMPAKNVTISTIWDIANNISLKASLVDGNYWTTFYCGDAGYRIDGDEEACAYTATVSDDKITLNLLGSVIPMGTAAIIISKDNSISMYRDDFSCADYSADNDLQGVDERTEKSALGEGTFYVLSKKSGNFGFFEYTGRYMPARKAYLLASGSNARSLTMVFDEDVTGVNEVKEVKEVKEVNDDSWYTINGVKLDGKATQKGLYIVNGKKVVIK